LREGGWEGKVAVGKGVEYGLDGKLTHGIGTMEHSMTQIGENKLSSSKNMSTPETNKLMTSKESTGSVNTRIPGVSNQDEVARKLWSHRTIF
jgi:hypothetical protein